MGFFSAVTKTIIETAKLPVVIVQDVFTLGGIGTDHKPYTVEKLEDIKRASEDK